MNIYHTVRLLDEYLSPEGMTLADANDPGLAGLEDNQAAWYGAGDGGCIVVVAVNTGSLVAVIYDADGSVVQRASWPRNVDLEVVVGWITGDV
jgi:hypothetical protein